MDFPTKIWGRYAVNRQKITQRQLQMCIEEQVKLEEKGVSKTLADIVVEKGYIDRENIQKIVNLEGMLPGYRMEKLLGSGGLGIVYKAYSEKLERDVAIKVLNPEYINNVVILNRFLREVDISKKLDHPNIIKGYDSGEIDDLYYLVLEYIDGFNLSNYILKYGPMKEDKIIDIAIHAVDALSYAWSKGLTHRDIKPENIMLTQSGTLKVGDFGLAKLVDANAALTMSGSIIGTPYYISPEQVSGDVDLDYRSDIYSLGATLYFLATGKPMFHETSVITVCYAHLNTMPSPPSKYAEVSEIFDSLILKMVNKRPSDRSKSQEEFVSYINSIPESYKNLEVSYKNAKQPQTPGKIMPKDTAPTEKFPINPKDAAQKELSKTKKEVLEKKDKSTIKSVLIVAPNDPNQKLIDEELTQNNLEVLNCEDIETGLKAYLEHSPDVVICYVAPKEKKTWDFLGTIKAQKSQDKNLYLVLLEEKIDLKTRMQAMLLGIKYYLTKPVTSKAISDTIDYIKKESLRVSTKIHLPRLKGTLKTISLSELLQILHNSGKTGILTIKFENSKGKIYITKGKIHHCDLGKLSPRGAFYEMLSWKTGAFIFQELTSLDQEASLDIDIMEILPVGLQIYSEISEIKNMLGGRHQADYEFVKIILVEEMISLEDIKGAIVEFKKQSSSEVSFIDFLKEQDFIDSNQRDMILEIQESKATDKGSLEEMPISIKEVSGIREDTAIKDGKKAKTGSSTVTPKARIEDTVIQQLLLSLNLMNMSQLSECISKQVALQLQGIHKNLTDIIAEEGYITLEHLQNLHFFRDEEGQSLIPNYEVVNVVGEGGIAIVYMARDVRDNKTVALKIFAPTTSDTSATIARFMREAEAAKKLNHPNIVKARDFGMIHGIYYLAMEYISGLSLSQIISKVGRLEESKALEILEHLADAFTYAWKQNIIHRDIKPSNILSDGDTLKICDLGLAKALESTIDLTQEGGLVGTPQYMSPEQFQPEKDLDFRTDIYSLGITFYVILTGHLPFTSNTKLGLAQAHLMQEPPPLEKFNVTVTKPTKALLIKMLSKDREKRAKDKDELLTDIKLVRGGKYPTNIPNEKKNLGLKLITVGSAVVILFALAFILFFIKAQPQEIKITEVSPKEGDKVYEENTKLSGYIESTDLDYVLVNNKRAEIGKIGDKSFKFEINLPLSIGQNKVNISCISKDNKKKDFEYFILRETLDKTPPTITITEPEGIGPGKNIKVNKSPILLKGYAIDDDAVKSISINDKEVLIMTDGNRANFQTLLELKEGMQIVKVATLDKSGNEKNFSFIALYEPPKKQIQIEVMPPSFSIEGGETQKLNPRILENGVEIKSLDEDWSWKAEYGECVNGIYKAPEKTGIDFITLTHTPTTRQLLIKVDITRPKVKIPIHTTPTKNKKGYYEKTFANCHLMIWIPYEDKDIEPTPDNIRKGFWISKYETSNEQYNNYLKSIGILNHIPLQKTPFMPDGYLTKPEYAIYPVVWVTWKDGRDYCNWIKKNLIVQKDHLLTGDASNLTVRMPTLKEAIKAAGSNPDLFPWGHEPPFQGSQYRANYDANYESKDKSDPKDEFVFTAPVTYYGGEPYNGGDGQSCYGVYNLAGNVSEWCWDSDKYEDKKKIVYGGSWRSRVETLKMNDVGLQPEFPEFQMDTIGFRIVFVQE